jgi:prevent-host-death family protein
MLTGEWLRSVASNERIVVTDRGRPIAAIVPYSSADATISFASRRETDAFLRLPRVNHDSTRTVSQDRDRG